MKRSYLVRIALAALVVLGLSSTADAVEWVARSNISVAEDSNLVTNLPNNGFVPIYSKVTVGAEAQLLIDVVYLKPLDVEWQYRRYDENTYEPKAAEFKELGFQLVSHQIYQFNDVTWHNAIWHKPKAK
ncbi:MAG: hypothetical protein C0483_05995 [Pirellula sp.]|nr:hypothetical protein [Pirellula sp.]